MFDFWWWVRVTERIRVNRYVELDFYVNLNSARCLSFSVTYIHGPIFFWTPIAFVLTTHSFKQVQVPKLFLVPGNKQ